MGAEGQKDRDREGVKVLYSICNNIQKFCYNRLGNNMGLSVVRLEKRKRRRYRRK